MGGGGGACNQIASYIDRKNREKEHSFSKCRHYDCQDDDPDDVIISGEESKQNALECQCSGSRKSSSVVYKKSNKLRSKYKIEYVRENSATQIMLWLLAFCVSAVFAICPLARHATRYNLSATTIKLDTFYINAPAYIAGDTSRGATGAVNGSSISATDGTLLNTGTIPALFEAGGSINTTVLKDLLTMINSCTTPSGTDTTNGVTYYSAKSFGAYDPLGNAQSDWDSDKKGNAQILVKLFNTAGNSDTDLMISHRDTGRQCIGQ